MCKNVFIDKYKQLNIIKDFKFFLQKIEESKPYILEFKENNIIKKRVIYLTM